jgi:hypothetical protein
MAFSRKGVRSSWEPPRVMTGDHSAFYHFSGQESKC